MQVNVHNATILTLREQVIFEFLENSQIHKRR